MKRQSLAFWVIAALFLFCSGCSSGDMPDKGVSILSPKANDVVQAGSTTEIRWKVEAADEKTVGTMFTIEFSADGGKSWEKVEENINKDDGKYVWKVPKIEKPECKIRFFSQRSGDCRGTSGLFAVK